jgi:hypothetical protein
MKFELVCLILPIAVILSQLWGIDFFRMWAFGDLSAFPSDSRRIFEWTFYIWRDEGIGFQNVVGFNYYILTWATSIVFGSVVAQKILFISTLILSFVSCFFLLKSFRINRTIASVSSFLYVVNPIVISSFAWFA